MKSNTHKLKMIGNISTFESNSLEHILSSMAKGGVEIAPNGCYGGGCGVCKIQILEGAVETLCMSKKYITDEEKKLGFVLACRAFPKSDIRFEFIGKPKCTRKEKKYGFV